MIAGHFGFAAIVKSRERQTPLWALMLACQWLDVLFVPLFLAGIEQIVPVPGARIPPGYGDVLIYADYTHSLAGSFAIAVVFGWIAALIWGKRTGIVLGGVVFSHWLLDLIVHRGDMPILPGNARNLPRLGFGLWRWHGAAIATELALVLVGAGLYWRAALEATEADGRRPTLAHVAGAVILISGLITLGLNVLGL
jgi:hypothetical protein